MKNNIEIMIVNENNLKDKIYIIRGQKVMLDSDLARIYGFSTKAFNQQIQRNIDKFDENFMFQLTKEETIFVMCQNGTSRNNSVFKGQNGGVRKLPYVFTEKNMHADDYT